VNSTLWLLTEILAALGGLFSPMRIIPKRPELRTYPTSLVSIPTAFGDCPRSSSCDQSNVSARLARPSNLRPLSNAEPVCLSVAAGPRGAFVDAALLTSDTIFVLNSAGAASFIGPDHVVSPAHLPLARSSGSGASRARMPLHRMVGMAGNTYAFLAPGALELVVGQRGRRPASSPIDWPDHIEEGQVAGQTVAGLVVPPVPSPGDSGKASIEIWSPKDGRWITRAAFRTHPRSIIGSPFVLNPGPFQRFQSWAVDARGNVWVGDALRPRITRFDANQNASTSIEWTAPAIPITAREIDSVRSKLYSSADEMPEEFRNATRQYTDSMLRLVPRNRPAILDIVAASDGTVWVRESSISTDRNTSWIQLTASGTMSNRMSLPESARVLDARNGTVLLRIDSQPKRVCLSTRKISELAPKSGGSESHEVNVLATPLNLGKGQNEYFEQFLDTHDDGGDHFRRSRAFAEAQPRRDSPPGD
jgi:hypothetical protein